LKQPNGVIAFLTDVGYVDSYAGSMEGVALSICPNVRTTCITHGIPSFDVHEAAFTLLSSYKYFPHGTVFVVIVVPGVGSSEKPILIVTKNYFFVGPDNGVLMVAAEDDGIEEAFVLDKYGYFRKPVSETFQGRDMSTPIAAYLVCGVSPQELGSPIDFKALTKIDLGFGYEYYGDCIVLRVIHVDKYGNIILSSHYRELASKLQVRVGDIVRIESKGKSVEALVEESFSSTAKGTLILYGNSYGFTELAINQGNAGDALTVKKKDKVMICKYAL